MAYINGIWIYKGDVDKKKITINMDLKPSGRDSIVIDLPEDFFDCIMGICQAAADLHEQKVRAQILTDTRKAEENGTQRTEADLHD